MKAIVQDRYGSPDVLELREIDKPVAADNEVLVQVHAAAVNAREWHIMRGDPYLARLMLGLGRPKVKIRGTDFAGRVEAVGRDVKRFRPADEVFGEVDGASAEYVCAPDDVVAPKPANLTFEQAAAVPLAGTPPSWACACSTRNVDLIHSIGADHVIDYTQEDFTRNERQYDVVFDLVGNRSLTDSRRTLTSTGTLVLSGGGVYDGGSLVGPMGLVLMARLLSPFVRHRVLQLTATPSRENLETLRELIESGKVSPVIDRTYPLSEVSEAIRCLEVEHARAKVVITV